MMTGEGVARVLISKHPYREGDIVFAPTGWRTHALSDSTGHRKLGVLGMPGFTAYSGLRLIGKPKPGETGVSRLGLLEAQRTERSAPQTTI